MKQFQLFRLDTNDECLWREGQRLALTRKAFDVLNYLVEQAGRLVPKEELMEAVEVDHYFQARLGLPVQAGHARRVRYDPDPEAAILKGQVPDRKTVFSVQ